MNYKRKIIFDIVISWFLFIGLFVLIIIEQRLDSPWDRITNGLWVIGTITMTFFLVRGLYGLVKYEIGKRSN